MVLEILVFLIWYVVFIISTVFHEAAHALTGRLGGDNTASSQVTLNPLPHIRRSLVGMIAVPIMSYLAMGFMFGYASAPYDPDWAYRHPRRASKMALAGPICNLSLAIWAVVLMRIGVSAGLFQTGGYGLTFVVSANGLPNFLTMFISLMLYLNLILFGFNLLPVPPLDGASVLGLFMTEDKSRQWQQFSLRPEYQIVAWLFSIWVFRQFVAGPLMAFGLWMLTA